MFRAGVWRQCKGAAAQSNWREKGHQLAGVGRRALVPLVVFGGSAAAALQAARGSIAGLGVLAGLCVAVGLFGVVVPMEATSIEVLNQGEVDHDARGDAVREFVSSVAERTLPVNNGQGRGH